MGGVLEEVNPEARTWEENRKPGADQKACSTVNEVFVTRRPVGGNRMMTMVVTFPSEGPRLLIQTRPEGRKGTKVPTATLCGQLEPGGLKLLTSS